MATNYQYLGSFTLGPSGGGSNTEKVDMDRYDIRDMQLFVTVAYSQTASTTGVQLVLKEAATPTVSGGDSGKWFKVGGFTTPADSKFDSVGETKTLNTVTAGSGTAVSEVTKIDIVETAVGRVLRGEFTNADATNSATVTLEAYI